MKVLIVIGDGDPHGAKDDEAREFLGYGGEIAKHCAEDGLSWEVFVPQRVEKWYQTFSPYTKDVRPTTYSGANDLAELLKTNEPKALIVIGHGFQTAGPSAVVQLCPDAENQERHLTTNHIDLLNPILYFGLHCYSGLLVDHLKADIIAFHLTGHAPGQNLDVKVFTEDAAAVEAMKTLLTAAVAFEDDRRELAGELKDQQKALTQAVNSYTGKTGQECAGWRV